MRSGKRFIVRQGDRGLAIIDRETGEKVDPPHPDGWYPLTCRRRLGARAALLSAKPPPYHRCPPWCHQCPDCDNQLMPGCMGGSVYGPAGCHCNPTGRFMSPSKAAEMRQQIAEFDHEWRKHCNEQVELGKGLRLVRKRSA